MKLLWITNILFPEAMSVITKESQLKASGGWMLGLASSLIGKKDLSLYIATVSPMVQSLTTIKGQNVTYYVIPIGKGKIKYNRGYEAYWKYIYQQCIPDVVHIHGTEYSHGLAFMKACPNAKVVISIQGMTSDYFHYYNSGISLWNIIRSFTIRDFLKGGLINGKKEFKQRGDSIEIPMLLNVRHVIGRTSWDQSHVWAINPKAKYHFCNETLRNEFYCDDCWDYNSCDKHSIFLSQASSPIKGLHFLLKAMPLILREYPDTKIRIGGVNITRRNSLKDIFTLSSYGRYIISLINKYNLDSHITFLGSLNAKEMKNEYLRCNVFVCPSTIENSPNSLGEAQILGTPIVASYVGGIPDMMKGCEENLYRFDDREMLAKRICQIFANQDKQINMRSLALERHDSSSNAQKLLNIYNEVLI